MFKVGDKVRVIKVDNVDIQRGIKVGDVFEVDCVLYIGIIIKDSNYLLRNDQVELVIEAPKLKVGDKVRVVELMGDACKVGDILTVNNVIGTLGVVAVDRKGNRYPMTFEQVELVTEPSKDEQLLQQLFDLAHEVVVLESQDSVTWEEVEQLQYYKDQIMQLVLGMVRNND